jgi:type I restriction enzyme R subunit
MKQTTEKAFESYVEQMLLSKGWQQGEVSDWDQERALFPQLVTEFIAVTQPVLWEAMRGQHGGQLESMVITALLRELAIKGLLHVLRHGFKFYGKMFRLAFFKPAHGLNEEVLELYRANRLTVTRQVPFHPGDHSAVDLLFAINSLPVATCELKNPWTGQSWRNAVRQYQEDRNPRAPLFDFRQRAWCILPPIRMRYI